MRRIRITVESIACEGELAETDCARAIWDALPLSTEANTWGDEIYFSIPVQQDLDGTAQEVVDMGDLGYWPQGAAFCIFFGPTPLSQGEEIRPASAVNIVGRITGDPTVFRNVPAGSQISVEKNEDA